MNSRLHICLHTMSSSNLKPFFFPTCSVCPQSHHMNTKTSTTFCVQTSNNMWYYYRQQFCRLKSNIEQIQKIYVYVHVCVLVWLLLSSMNPVVPKPVVKTNTGHLTIIFQISLIIKKDIQNRSEPNMRKRTWAGVSNIYKILCHCTCNCPLWPTFTLCNCVSL